MQGLLVEQWMPFDQLELQDIEPAELGPRDVRLRTQAAGISFALSLVVQGKYQRKPPRPFVPGTEVAGVVAEVGAEVTRFKPGDRVCAVLDWGALAEECVAKEVNTYQIPDSLEFCRAISFTNSYATSHAALTAPHLLNVQRDRWLLVHGAAGGVGLAAVEIGKILGARVIATAGSAEKLEIATRHGADFVINYREESFRDRVLEITNQRGVDAVYDPVGGDVFMQSLRCMAPEARIMPVGFASGEVPQIPANLLLVKNLSVCGLNMGLYFGWGLIDLRYEYEPAVRSIMEQLFDWFTADLIDPVVTKTYPLTEYRQAMDDVLQRKSLGRIAIVMDQERERLGHSAG